MPTIAIPLNRLAHVLHRYGVAAQRESNACLPQVARRAEVIVTSATRNAPPASQNGGIGAVNYGQYLKAWSARVIRQAGTRGVLVGNTRGYAPVIDYGRRPGAPRPPIEAIARWATKKFGITYAQAKKRAWPIAQNIKKRGLRPRGVLHGSNTTQDLSDAMETAVGAALDRAAHKMVIP